MTRCLRWSVVALSVVLVAAVSTPALAHAPAGGQDQSGVPAGLVILDYEPFVLALDDVRSVSGLAPGEPYTSEEPTGFGILSGGENVPALCGEVAGRFEAGATGDIRGAGASGVEVVVQNRIGGVTDAKEILADLKALAKDCNAPYTGGSVTFTPAAQQPKVKKAGDGVVAFAATTSAPQAATLYQLFVRDGRYFVSSLLLAFPGTGELGRTHLDRLAKRMGDHLAELEREFQRS